MAAVSDTGLRCLSCQYNLTGLITDVCPECGSRIDWDLTRSDREARRRGTPAHRALGQSLAGPTGLTVLAMLFTPWRFARQLRPDESMGPPLLVAVLSYLVLVVVEWSPSDVPEMLMMALTVTFVILAQSFSFASLSRRGASRLWSWGKRFRFWLLVSLYSTCFVAAWPLAGPPILVSWNDANFYWPFGGNPELPATIIFYWWWAILTIVLLIRNRPVWLAGFASLLVFLWTRAATGVYLWLDALS